MWRTEGAYRRNGNVLLDDLFGATVHRRPGNVDALAVAQERAEQLSVEARRAHVVGSGGSSPLGCLGYVLCAEEIMAQELELGLRFDRIIVPNGSSGTDAGLAAGMKAAGDEPAGSNRSPSSLRSKRRGQSPPNLPRGPWRSLIRPVRS
jgi:L-cysteate sulfo-lyase